MTDEDIKRYIEATVEQTVSTLKRKGVLKDSKDMMYSEVSYMLTAYYQNGQKIPKLEQALEQISGDTYFSILPEYYGAGVKIEDIAYGMGVDVSTIVRNKKRLCLELYIALI